MQSLISIASISTAATLAFGIAVVLIMPGPTNTLLAAAGARRGIKGGLPLVAAELAGYLVAISAWGGMIAYASGRLDWLPALMRVASALYVARLAIRLWRAAAELSSSATDNVSTRTLFTATLLNPKAMLFGASVLPATAFADARNYLLSMAVFAITLIPISLLWVRIGAMLASGRITWLCPQRFQKGASVVLGAFSVAILWNLAR
jgi:threonine/homoserine/homoserine lactone efflux protein